ncbi:MAG: glutamate--tRNA ligase [Eubacterium sp.]|jgi:glutamyl-tRNA synthetase|nr:glutamate--tRNA ligase [Eubacterium sp.]
MDGKKIRTRFAPSPTGFMHLGNLRTALYTYLIAKKNNGDFILRIEDTDRERYVDGAVNVIYNSLKQCGLNWDEGPDIGGNYGPYIQSERMDIYREHASKLIKNAKAYYCFCGKDRMDAIHEEQKSKGLTPFYDRHCRNLSDNEVKQKLSSGTPYVIRQKIPTEGRTIFHDEIYGDITVQNSELDDQILIKSDGMPTYNFANVIDDHTMEITHVVRGNEYLSSAPKYNLLYESFGWEAPVYIHVEQIMRDAAHKLSKRDGDAYFDDFIKQGYLIPAILNYIALLGWAPKGENEIFNLDELKKEFDISGISKSPAIFDPIKMRAINGMYIRALSLEEFISRAKPYVRLACKREDIDYKILCAALQPRTELLTDIPSQVDFIDELPEYETSLFENKKMKTDTENSREILRQLLPMLETLDNYQKNILHDNLMAFVEKSGLKNGQVLFPLRVALSGKTMTPGGGVELCAIIGKDETVRRIKIAIKKLA